MYEFEFRIVDGKLTLVTCTCGWGQVFAGATDLVGIAAACMSHDNSGHWRLIGGVTKQVEDITMTGKVYRTPKGEMNATTEPS